MNKDSDSVILELGERMARVETHIQHMAQDISELKTSYREFKRDIFNRLDSLTVAINNNKNNPMDRKTKIAIYAALISSLGLILSKLIEILPLIL